MSTFRQIKLLLAAVIVFFVAAGAYISTLVVERQQALEQESRYNVAWLVGQAATEYVRLEQRLSAYAWPDSPVSRDEVELRFDIIVSRLNLLNSGDVEEFLASDPEHRATVHDLGEAVASAQPLVAALDKPGNVRKLLALLMPLDGRLARLAAAANRFGGDRVSEDQRQLIVLHWQFSALAGGLIVCGIVLITLLIWHNRLLRRAHRELHELAAGIRIQNRRFDAALNNMSQGLCMFDASQRLIVCNEQYCELFDLPPDAAQPGTPLRDLIARTFAPGSADSTLGSVLAQQQVLIQERRPASYFQELPDGRTIAVSHQPMAEGGWVATYGDISERRRAEARIAHMAHYDALTDLPNRVLLRERIGEACASESSNVAVLSLDLDRFKAVNDTLGHSIGDALLTVVAKRISGCVREGDAVARLGGDEFVVMQRDGADDADAMARRIIEHVGAPYEISGHNVVIGTSVGIAIAPKDGTTPDELLKNADLALYRAKTDGRATYRFFEPGMDAELQGRRLLELDLRKALGAGEFELHYQPVVDLASGAITGCEALLRWRHPARGMVPPATFIGIAEDIGLIVPIGEWVLRQACTQAARWPAAIKVAVNLSPLQLVSRDLLHTVVLALANSGLSATRLELEITESVFLQDNENTLAILNELRGLGVGIAMDDFGTGYSSLSYLRSFPFDKIKLDQSFVRDLSDRSDCMAIVNSIASLGRDLGMVTTAEGIETEKQLEVLRTAGFTEGQGYHFWRPMPAAALTQLLREHTPAAAA